MCGKEKTRYIGVYGTLQSLTIHWAQILYILLISESFPEQRLLPNYQLDLLPNYQLDLKGQFSLKNVKYIDMKIVEHYSV